MALIYELGKCSSCEKPATTMMTVWGMVEYSSGIQKFTLPVCESCELKVKLVRRMQSTASNTS